MFRLAAAFNEDLSGWDVTKVTTFYGTFRESGLNQVLCWDTGSYDDTNLFWSTPSSADPAQPKCACVANEFYNTTSTTCEACPAGHFSQGSTESCCVLPTPPPSPAPTLSPSLRPTAVPTLIPFPAPTNLPIPAPSPAPTLVPLLSPTPAPTLLPSSAPSQLPGDSASVSTCHSNEKDSQDRYSSLHCFFLCRLLFSWEPQLGFCGLCFHSSLHPAASHVALFALSRDERRSTFVYLPFFAFLLVLRLASQAILKPDFLIFFISYFLQQGSQRSSRNCSYHLDPGVDPRYVSIIQRQLPRSC